MQLIGTVTRLQIQRDRLKEGKIPNRVYRTTPLMQVDTLKLTPRGVFGLQMDGAELIDVHHIDHPNSRNRKNANGLSFNFTSHYVAMQLRFGKHFRAGDAGENIMIAAMNAVPLAELGSHLIIENASTKQHTRLDNLMIAEPCAEFSYYCAKERITGERLKEVLKFLSFGMRGYYATFNGDENPIIHEGDRVYAVH